MHSFRDVATSELPSPNADLSETLASFASRGFDLRETVSLLGTNLSLPYKGTQKSFYKSLFLYCSYQNLCFPLLSCYQLMFFLFLCYNFNICE
jgi:hypothetical protein